jgi:hypothetical protein
MRGHDGILGVLILPALCRDQLHTLENLEFDLADFDAFVQRAEDEFRGYGCAKYVVAGWDVDVIPKLVFPCVLVALRMR